MKKILFAIGHKSTEDAINKKLNEEQFQVCGVVTYKGGVVKQLEEKRPDILIIRENLKGSEDLLSVTYEIRTQFPSVRVIVLADATSPENKTLATLVSWGIYDIISGKTIKLMNIIDLIENPRTLKDMSKYKLVNLPFNPPSEVEEALNANEEDEADNGKSFFGRFKKKKNDSKPKNPYLSTLVEKESELNENSEKIEELKTLIKEKEEKLGELKLERKTLEERYEEIESEYVDKEETVNILRNKVIDTETKIEELSKDLESLKEQKVVLEHDLKVKTDESVNLNLEIEGIKKKIENVPKKENLLKEKECLDKIYEKKEEELSSLKKYVEEKKDNLSNIKFEISQLIEENEHLKEKTGLSKEELQELKTIKEEELVKKQEKYESLVKEIEEVETKISNIDSNIENKEEALSKAKIELTKKTPLTYYDYDFSNVKKEKITYKDKINPEDVLKKYEEFKVLAFVGSKHGVGCSTIALNTAALLAKKNKVLYIEVNEKFPLSSYLFELLNITSGLEYAVDYAVKGKANIIKEEILISEKKDVPENLNFLTFSNSYLINEKSSDLTDFTFEGLKMLLEKIKETLDYDLIVLDLQPDENKVTDAVLSKKIPIDYLFMVLTQDVHSIGSACYKKEQIEYSQENINYETTYLINRYNSNYKLNLMKISKWMNVKPEKFTPVLLDDLDLMDLSYEGKFYSLNSNKGFGLGEILKEIK
jgi:cellulose biosynthesis protein BcsQ